MRLFSEAALLKMETSCTRNRQDWETPPPFISTYLYPALLLKPNEAYTRKSYLQTSIVHTVAVVLLICLMSAVIFGITLLIWPQLWSAIIDPKNHAQQIGILSQEGFYYLPLTPLIWLSASLAINWPRYFCWNRRAKRLQREGPISVPIVAAAIETDDPNVWPPPPRP